MACNPYVGSATSTFPTPIIYHHVTITLDPALIEAIKTEAIKTILEFYMKQQSEGMKSE